MTKRSLWFIGLLIAGGGQAYAVDDATCRTADSNVAQWNEAFAPGKVEDILSLDADDAMLVQPNGAVSRSPGEIRAFWQTVIEKKSGVFTIDTVEVKGEKEEPIMTTT